MKKSCLFLLLLIFANPCYAASQNQSIPKQEDLSPLLQSEFAKTDSSQILDTLLQNPPPSAGDKMNFAFPDERYMLRIGQQKLPPIKLEATYNAPITLEEALNRAMNSNLPIKISDDFYRSKKALFVGALGRFLPDLSMTYRYQNIYQSGDKLANVKTGNTTLTWAYFQGGKVLFGSVGAYYDTKAAKAQLNTSINDVLLEAYKRYNDVLYNQALLQVRIKSLETSRANLTLTKQQFSAGTGTKFAVMQSESQLAFDAQNLVNQQVATRKSVIALAVTLNSPVDVNLLPRETDLDRLCILDPKKRAGDWTNLAIANRPEVKALNAQYKAAKASIAQSASPLFPTAQIFVSPSNTTIGGALAGSGGAGALAAGGSGAGVNLSTAGTGATSVNVGGVIGKSTTLGTSLTWNLSGLGVPDTANIEANRLLARRVLNQYNQQILSVTQEVHNAFLELQAAEEQITIAEVNVRASREGLRLASRRLQLGNGTNLELIQAQRSYVEALTSQIRAFVDYRNAQAQLLRDCGTITISNLVNEYRQPITN